MFVNCSGKLYAGNKEIKTVQEFRYLGINIVNNRTKPDYLLADRIQYA
jgi:hypothetical protein